MEAKHGTVIYAASNGNLEMYPDNNPSAFINLLKTNVKLDPDIQYTVKLHNFHIPLHETSLIAGDYEESSIKYNVGLFYYDKRKTGRYMIDPSSVRNLFTLAPEVNIDGVFGEGEHHFNIGDPSNDINKDLGGGKPSVRSLKEDFINRVGLSLKLNDKETNLDKKNREIQLLRYFKETLRKNPRRKANSSSNLSGPNNLMGRFLSDLNYFMFNEFTFLDQNQLFFFVSRIMWFMRYEDERYFDWVKWSSQVPRSIRRHEMPTLTKAGTAAERAPEKFKNYIRAMEAQCPGLNMFHAYTDDQLRKILRKDTKLDVVQDIITDACPTHHRASSLVYVRKKSELKKAKHRVKLNNMSSSSSSSSNDVFMRDAPVPAGDEEGVQKGEIVWITGIDNNDDEGPQEATTSTTTTTTTTNDEEMLADDGSQQQQWVVPPHEPFRPFIGVFITFGKRMARFFNVKESQYVLLAHFGFPSINYSDYYIKLTPNFNKPKIEKLFIYSDVVKPCIRLGGFLTNLLDVVSVSNANTINRPLVSGSDKPLKNHSIDSISILTTNEDGDRFCFEDNAQATFEIHIQPRQENH